MAIGIVYTEFDILCLVLMAMITISTLTQSKKLVYQYLYLILMIMSIVLVASDMVYEMFLGGLIHVGLPLLYASNMLYFIASMLIAYTWFSYSQRLAGDKLIEHFRFRIAMFLPAAFTTAAIISSPFTHWIFYLDPDGSYHRGSANWISFVFPLFYFVLSVAWTVVDHLRNKSGRTERNLRSTMAFVIFPLAATGTQIFFEGAPMVCIGAVLGMLWIYITNITQEREQMAAGQMVAETRTQFFASMSHELRSPINAVLGMNTIIQRESTESNIRDYAHMIENSGKMLLSTVNDILDFSKAEAGNLTLSTAEYKTADVVRDLIMMIRDRAEGKGLEFIPAIDKNIPSIMVGDETRIKQVIINLLTNAVKYTDEGSVTLRMTYRNIDATTIKLNVAVSDTGRGIRKEDMEALFTPYSRLDENLNRKAEGTGLGMSVVKTLLGLMDSEIVVDSEYGVGSTFSFTIVQKVISREIIGPIDAIMRPETAGTADTPAARRMFTAESARILSVDDTVVNLAVFKGLLKSTMIQIDTAISGEESLKMAKEHAYDIIFMDHMMPKMDGVEALHRLRSEDNLVTEDTPILVLTANVIAGYREMFMQEGFTDFVPKPVEIGVLEDMLLKYLPKEKINYLE